MDSKAAAWMPETRYEAVEEQLQYWKEAKTTEFFIKDGDNQLDIEIICLQQRRNKYFGKSHTATIKAERWCSNCGKKGEGLLTCARCKSAFYCSKECQKSNWREHKRRCKEPVSLVEDDDRRFSFITELLKYQMKMKELDEENDS